MEVSLYQAAAAMNATDRWQEMISQNLSGASTPGARKNQISFSAVQAGMTSNVSGFASSGFVIPSAGTVTNFQQGELHSTGNSMDVALEGPGFFSVKMPDGQSAYTRNGEFQLNAQSQLATSHGNLVLGDSGPIQFEPGSSLPITISASGDVSQGAEVKGKLKITEFSKPNLLAAIGGGLFRADNKDLKPADAVATSVRQGNIESANTSPTLEMAGLITAMRMFESNQKVLQMQSDRMGRMITDLGNPG